MKKKITYKNKLLYLLISGGLFCVILYNLAISDTLNLAIENNTLEGQIIENIDAPKQIQSIKQKLLKIEQLIGDKNQHETNVHQLLLESITQYNQKKALVLQDFPQPFISSNNGYVTKTAKVTVEGDFINLLKLVYFLEQNYQIGKVVSVNFETTKELYKRKRELHSTIYIQDIKAIKDENNL
ncbi:MAG: hypothetical protein HYU68_13595 [Bacteroidetes bacterium]|nr:hypothetical protein [Bacteroidota bacterium]